MKLMREWEVLATERRCEVGQVSVNDVVKAIGEALDQGVDDEEWRRIKGEMDRIASEHQEIIREGSARVSRAIARRRVEQILKEGRR